MKPQLSFLCLLLTASATCILPVLSEEASGKPTQTEEQLAHERLMACHAAIENQVLRHINQEVSQVHRFSRVVRPMPLQYHTHQIVSANADGMIEFRITHINRMLAKPAAVVVATGTFNGKTGELLLKDDQSGKSITASGHPLVKKKSNT